MLWLERYERLVVARAAVVEDPQGFFEQQMAAFDEALVFDPENSKQTEAERRLLELVEEAA